MIYRLIRIKDTDYVFSSTKSELIEKVIRDLGNKNYYLYHDQFCSSNYYDMKWNVCIIVISEPDSDNNISAEKLIHQLNSIGINNDIIINSKIDLTNNGNTITVEFPLAN